MTPEEEIVALKHQLQALQLRNQVSQEQLLREQLSYSPPYDLINPWSQLFDGQQLIFPLFPSRWDYRLFNSGIWVSEAQLDLIRMYARFLHDTNLVAQGIIRGKANYVIKTGFEYQVQAKKHANPSATLVGHAQRVIDDFCTKNRWYLRELDLYRRTNRDGEGFGRLFPSDDAITRLRTVEPEQVRPPDSSPEWLFGVRVDMDDKEVPLGYWVTYDGDVKNGDEVSPEFMFHIKIGVDLAIRRGLSKFFAPQETLQGVQKLLRAGVQGESVRQAIAYVREHAQASPAAVQSLQAASTDYLTPIPTAQGIPRLQPVQHVEPGSVQDVPEGLTYKPPPVASAQNCQLILQLAYQQLAVYFQTPEWMASGTTGTVNFAASLTAEAPFTRECECEQKFYGGAFKEVMFMVLRIAEAQGVLPEDTCEQIDINVVCPPVAVRDKKAETERNKVLSEEGLLSDETWAAMEELDLEHEREQGAERRTEAKLGEDGRSMTPGAQYQREVDRP